MTKPYKPQAKNAAVLGATMSHVQDLLYSVSLRAVFYFLYQRGYYANKMITANGRT